MKLRNFLFFLSGFFCFMFSQTIPYQAILRDINGSPKPNFPVSVTVKYFNAPTNSTPVYEEVFTTTTNAFGLFDLNLGSGSPQSGSFNAINWSGGNVLYEIWINSQVHVPKQYFQYVPYAFYANQSGGSSGQIWSINASSTAIIPSATYSAMNVGIGTATPQAPLEVVSLLNSTAAIRAKEFNILNLPGHAFEGYSFSNNSSSSAFLGISQNGNGVYAATNSSLQGNAGVIGTAPNGASGVIGISKNASSSGIVGINLVNNTPTSTNVVSTGVFGMSYDMNPFSAGVLGMSKGGAGVAGVIDTITSKYAIVALTQKSATTSSHAGILVRPSGQANGIIVDSISQGKGIIVKSTNNDGIFAYKVNSASSGHVANFMGTSSNSFAPLRSMSDNTLAPAILAESGSNSRTALELRNGHLKAFTTSSVSVTSSFNPSLAVTYTTNCNDVVGEITFNVISVNSPQYLTFTINFNKPYNSFPIPIVSVFHENQSQLNLLGPSLPPFHVSFGTLQQMNITLIINTSDAGKKYKITYFVIEK
jgi:hypothetical protein